MFILILILILLLQLQLLLAFVASLPCLSASGPLLHLLTGEPKVYRPLPEEYG